MTSNFALMCEDTEAAARSRANVARRKNDHEDWYNKTTPDSRYALLYVNTKNKRLRSIPMLLGSRSG